MNRTWLVYQSEFRKGNFIIVSWWIKICYLHIHTHTCMHIYMHKCIDKQLFFTKKSLSRNYHFQIYLNGALTEVWPSFSCQLFKIRYIRVVWDTAQINWKDGKNENCQNPFREVFHFIIINSIIITLIFNL